MHRFLYAIQFAVLVIALVAFSVPLVAGDRLLGHLSMSNIEGASGGMLVPWATIGKGDAHENFSTIFSTSLVETDDFSMSKASVTFGMLDWLEFSIARLSLQRDQSADVVRQNALGLKIRLNQGYIYETPLWSLGLQHKSIDNSNDLSGLGFSDRKGVDLYLAGTYMQLASFIGRNVIYSGNARYTKANQLGLFGFGSIVNSQDDFEVVLEASAAIQLNSRLLMGLDYRDKPDKLSASPEDAWYSLYMAYSPADYVSMAVSWIELGSLLDGDEQSGALMTVEVSF